MTWRRFVTLLGGLSADSRWVHAARQAANVRTIDDPAAAEAYFQTI